MCGRRRVGVGRAGAKIASSRHGTMTEARRSDDGLMLLLFAFHRGRVIAARSARAVARGSRPRWKPGTADDEVRAGIEEGRASLMWEPRWKCYNEAGPVSGLGVGCVSCVTVGWVGVRKPETSGANGHKG